MPEGVGYPPKKKKKFTTGTRLTATEAAARAPKEFARAFPRTRGELVKDIGKKTKELRQLNRGKGKQPKKSLADVPTRRRRPAPGATAEAAKPARRFGTAATAEGTQAVDERARKRGAPTPTAEAAKPRRTPRPARKRETPPGRLQELFEMGLISKRDLGREMRLEEKRILGR